ncbi:MAG: amidohydrolase [Candidatus Acetothermia bacterium]|jgi:predicted amidohydrolase YtcJ|nr:amidohydrolase [Candidatus Acetothermia bacterium]
MAAELILHGGSILGGEAGADAVAVRCGHIAAVGRSEEILRLRGPATRVIPLHGRALLPGFFDAHTHFVRVGLERTFYVDLGSARSLSEAVDRLREAAKARPGEWVVGRGWDESRWPERRYLERGDLDRAVPRQPCCAVRVDGHLVACNTLALARCPRPEGEFVDRDRGHLWEEAAWELTSAVRPERETLVEAVAAACQYAASLGVTAVADMAGAADLPVYQIAERRGLLRTRTFLYLPLEQLPALQALGVRTGFGSPLLRVMGVKAFVDGSIGARTAALQDPYRGEMGHGRVLLGRAELAQRWKRAMDAGLQVAIHAIGDRAVEEVLAAARLSAVGAHDRHRVEHLELATPEQLDRMSGLGLIASMQPNFVAQWSGPGKMYEERLGPERDARIDPHAWVVERGIPLAFGSDGMPMGPLYGIGAVLDPPHPVQRLPLEAALRAYTHGAAYAAFAEGGLGSIAPGQWADLVVLSADPQTSPWSGIRVDMTFLAGEPVFKGAAS